MANPSTKVTHDQLNNLQLTSDELQRGYEEYQHNFNCQLENYIKKGKATKMKWDAMNQENSSRIKKLEEEVRHHEEVLKKIKSQLQEKEEEGQQKCVSCKKPMKTVPKYCGFGSPAEKLEGDAKQKCANCKNTTNFVSKYLGFGTLRKSKR